MIRKSRHRFSDATVLEQANIYVLHHAADDVWLRRWGLSAAAIVAAHIIAVALLGRNWNLPAEIGVTVPTIMVDLAPITASPDITQQDVAPGPVMREADASPPEPAPAEIVPEQLAPTPPQEKPEVVAPPEQKLKPAPEKKPEPAKVVPDKEPPPVKPKVVRPDARKPSDAPAPRTSAPSRAERQAPVASAASAGASASALASYNARVRAHLARFHQYPAGANGQTGTAVMSFSLGRGGGVSGSRLSRSSGVAALDAQAAAMVRQASPFPPIPPEIKDGSLSFSIPVNFTRR